MIVFISLVLLGFYALLILVYFWGWLQIPTFEDVSKSSVHFYTIIVPARNEESVIERCIHDILQQDFDTSRFEILVVNDHSDDFTAMRVEAYIKTHQLKHVHLLHMKDDPHQRMLKKAAITYGIEKAKGDYIILTDADCERGEGWLKAVDAFVAHRSPKMIYAPVVFKADNIFEKIQSMEFAGLVAIGASAIQLKNPNMCSAANLLFEKTAFYEVNGYVGNEGIASGDDEFLLHKIFKRYPNDVHFFKNKEAIVQTSANVSIAQLADQRKRWVSKSTKYENRFITAILVAAYFFNALILYNLLMQPSLGLLMLGVKALVEGLFLFSVLRFFNKSSFILLLPAAELFHILYVLIIGIWANIATYEWKGRSVK